MALRGKRVGGLRGLSVAFALVAAGVPGGAAAQAPAWPQKSIRMIVGFPAGGPVDIVARSLATRLSESLGQAVIVDNRAGAAGIVGTEVVAKSPPDGYTLSMAASTIAIHPTLYAKLPYDTFRDLAPVVAAASASLVLVVHPSVPARTTKELIALAKARPGQLNYASPGTGTANHLSGEMLKSMAGIDVIHVPYKGGAPAEIDLIGGHATFMFNTIASALPHVRGGRLRAIALSTARRSPAAPDIPTIAETGLPGFDAGSWYGVIGPAALPREIIQRMNADVNRALGAPDVKERMAGLGLDSMGGTPEQFGEFIRSEIAKWAKVIRASGARAE